MSNKSGSKKKITQKDIAMAADVSIATVSMALANSPKIPEPTRQMILEIARRLDYQILQKNRQRYQKVEHNIGLIIDTSAANAHIWGFLRIMIDSLAKEIQFRDSTFIMLPVSPLHNKDDVLKMIMRSGVSGVISFIYAEEPVLIELEAQGIPVILTFNELRPDGFFYVGHDDFQGGYEAARYLLKLGHQRIAYAYARRNNIPFLQSNRFVGYKKAITEWHIELSPKFILEYSPENLPNFNKQVADLMQSEAAPTAFVCLDDNIAFVLYHALTQSGYSIPKDVSIISHGDTLDYSNPITPQISTMYTDLELICSICCNILFNRFENPEKSYSSIKTRETFIDRGSCTKPKAE